MKKPKNCPLCGHSAAAHVDEERCALCGCTPQRREFVQQSLGFRSALPGRAAPTARKR
jgi:ribosomal protein L37E